MTDRCAVPRCRRDVEIVYLGRALCGHHWDELAAEEPVAMEEPMESTNETVSETTETKPAAESAAKEETAMPPKETAKKKSDAKPSKKAQTTKAAKPAKEPKVKGEKTPKEQLCVFACRVAEAERVAFHEATGPAGATRFARKLMVVFTNEDEAGFRALLKEAREARG